MGLLLLCETRALKRVAHMETVAILKVVSFSSSCVLSVLHIKVANTKLDTPVRRRWSAALVSTTSASFFSSSFSTVWRN